MFAVLEYVLVECVSGDLMQRVDHFGLLTREVLVSLPAKYRGDESLDVLFGRYCLEPVSMRVSPHVLQLRYIFDSIEILVVVLAQFIEIHYLNTPSLWSIHLFEHHLIGDIRGPSLLLDFPQSLHNLLGLVRIDVVLVDFQHEIVPL